MSKRVVFFGTPAIAVSCLKALLDEKINVVAVVTKPDKPIGRRQLLEKTPVKVLAESLQINVLQPDKVNDIYNQLQELQPDLYVVCAYGKLLSEKVLSIPTFRCVNVHTSLLPRWRGGAPIHYAVLNDDKESGVSLMYMVKELDAGNVIYQKKIALEPKETYRSLYDKLSTLAYEVLREQIQTLFDKNLKSIPQDTTKVTIAKNISRDDEKINWLNTAQKIEQQIRGLFDQPIAYSNYANENIKIYQGFCTDFANTSEPGTIVQINKNGIDVTCGDTKILRITKLQLPGKKPIRVTEMVNGNHPFTLNNRFI